VRNKALLQRREEKGKEKKKSNHRFLLSLVLLAAGDPADWRDSSCTVVRQQEETRTRESCSSSGSGSTRRTRCRTVTERRWIYEVTPQADDTLLSAALARFGSWEEGSNNANTVPGRTEKCLVPRRTSVLATYDDLLAQRDFDDNTRVIHLFESVESLEAKQASRAVAVYFMIVGFSLFGIIGALGLFIYLFGDKLGRSSSSSSSYGGYSPTYGSRSYATPMHTMQPYTTPQSQPFVTPGAPANWQLVSSPTPTPYSPQPPAQFAASVAQPQFAPADPMSVGQPNMVIPPGWQPAPSDGAALYPSFESPPTAVTMTTDATPATAGTVAPPS
jgi:hypothetical protein